MICEKCEALNALIDGYRRERDEARAEVERLEALLVQLDCVLDKLRWVSQEAKAACMLGYTGPNHETLRKALAQLAVNDPPGGHDEF